MANDKKKMVEVNATHERAGAEEESGAGNKAEN